MKVDLRVAKVLTAERVPNSKKLVKLRSISAPRADARRRHRRGLRGRALVGRHVVIVANLKPAKLMGIESNGMVLAASPDGGKPILLGFNSRPRRARGCGREYTIDNRKFVIDSHCHLADEVFVADLDAVVARAQAAGMTQALCILSADEPARSSGPGRSRWPAVRFAAAIHPHQSGAYAGRVDDVVEVTREAMAASEAVAVGEIGLDYHYDFSPRDVQRDVFAAQVALAVELERPVVIHTREAIDDTLAVLRDAGQDRARGVMHCFTGTKAEARRISTSAFSSRSRAS